MQYDARVMTTDILREIARNSREAGFNRQAPDEILEQAAEEGLHLIIPMMVHTHAAGKKVDPHLRCQVMVKLPDADEAASGVLDVRVEDFSRLPGVREILEEVAPEKLDELDDGIMVGVILTEEPEVGFVGAVDQNL